MERDNLRDVVIDGRRQLNGLKEVGCEMRTGFF
jgi:hypothetical protein